MNRYCLAILYIIAVASICVTLALYDSPFLAFFLALFLMDNVSVNSSYGYSPGSFSQRFFR